MEIPERILSVADDLSYSDTRHEEGTEFVRVDLYDAMKSEVERLKNENHRLEQMLESVGSILESVLILDKDLGVKSTVHDIATHTIESMKALK